MRTITMLRNLLLATMMFSSTFLSRAQEIGVDVCSCAPNTYEFTFDFSLTCPPVNITLGDAVSATSCLVSPNGDASIVDLVPVSVQSIEVLELGQDLRVLVQQVMNGNFLDGDTFMYSSITSTPSEITGVSSLPRAIQINFNAVNALDQPLLNFFVITFTNRCDTYPVLFEGQSAGWVRFMDLGIPRQEFCPIAPGPTPAPSLSALPSAAPSNSPTIKPTSTPSNVPTSVPTAVPSNVPTSIPTSAPTQVPSWAPSAVPTPEPTPVAFNTPVAMTDPPAMDVSRPSPPTGPQPRPPQPRPPQQRPPQRPSLDMSMSMGYASNDWMRMLVEDGFEDEVTDFGRKRKLRNGLDRY